MPIIRGETVEIIKTPGGNMSSGLATPSQGAAESSVIRQRQLPGGTNPRHSHDREEVMVMLAGAVTLTISDERHVLGVGDVVIIPSQISHQIENVGDAPAEWLLVAPAHMRYFHDSGDEAIPPWAE